MTAVEYYLDGGIPSEQLVLGIGLYGRSWTLADANVHGVGASSVGAGLARTYTREDGYAAYYEVCARATTQLK